MTAIAHGPVSWRADRDDNGFRTYHVIYEVSASRLDSPYNVMHAVGLPTVGSPMSVLGFFGIDEWAWCRPEMHITIMQEKKGDPAEWYEVDVTFSNHYEENRSHRCGDMEVLSPLLEPQKVRGGTLKMPWEPRYDRHGHRLVTSANEPLTGQNVTFDYGRHTVHIEQNVANLQLPLLTQMFNTVNSSPLWGVPARCVKLTNVAWERKVMLRCSYFYVRILDFEVDNYMHDKDGNKIGFDKEVWDSGSMCLRGHWVTDANSAAYGSYMLTGDTLETCADPLEGEETPEGKTALSDVPQGDLVAYKDMNYENTRCFLDGSGRPANASLVGKNEYESLGTAGPPANWVIEFYDESNFLQLGIPTSF